MHPITTPELAAAVTRVADVFAGQAAGPQETGCLFCYGEEEIAWLRDPGAPLPDEFVLHVAREVPSHWTDNAAVMRRILPRLAVLVAEGERVSDADGLGLGGASWQEWPGHQAEAVRVFLDAYWAAALHEPLPAHTFLDLFGFCEEAHGSPTPCLARWESETGPVADAHLLDFVEDRIDDLLSPARTYTSQGGWVTADPRPDAELISWVLHHAAPRIGARGDAGPDLLYRLDQLALPEEQRWADMPLSGR
ncbi:hypothetical protein LE181_29845 [Streptomyces sp. SCA3-4]|uniref:hypothetical protein n=1 Tax=Streptomyces sichuanensis TaxID=2871810 RepID=UPI001CE38723|nr:hypothetical protein [Streptomyces sichuanensis]MCA6096356.1 hypothetical protein [Streptomyces sichuanensis]